MNVSHCNIEVKARCDNPDLVRELLRKNHAEFKGIDYQRDTYFKVSSGRLKLREGNLENHLVYYRREDISGPKKSEVILVDATPTLKDLIFELFETEVIVDKRREIYFVGNVKLHVDDVEGLGKFVEIEANDDQGRIGLERLEQQCNKYMRLLEIKKEDLIDESYSDMLVEKNKEKTRSLQ